MLYNLFGSLAYLGYFVIHSTGMNDPHSFSERHKSHEYMLYHYKFGTLKKKKQKKQQKNMRSSHHSS